MSDYHKSPAADATPTAKALQAFLTFADKNPTAAGMLLKSSLREFIAVFHAYLFNQPFTFRPFHIELIDLLQSLVFDPDKWQGVNLYIGMPPRFGKSQICKYFSAWSIAINPLGNHLYTSYSAGLSIGASKEIRGIVDTPLYHSLFGVTLDAKQAAGDDWRTSAGGVFRAAGLDGTITGFGAGISAPGWGGCIFVDDYMKAGDFRSAAAKESVKDFYQKTLISRRNKPETPIIIIAQRIAKDDLIGFIEETERGKWHFHIVKGFDEEKQAAVWEDKMPTETLLMMKETNPFTFYSQYQQEPRVLGGGFFKTEWWRFYSPDADHIYSRIFLVGDTAMKTGEQNDYTVFAAVGITRSGGEIHLLDLVRGKFEAPDLEKIFLSFWEKWKNGNGARVPRASGFYLEDKASGTGLIQSVRRKGVPIVPMRPTADKFTRATEAAPYIASGLFQLPESENNSISRQVIAEAEEFRADMRHAHDDIIDVICYAIEKATGNKGLF